MALRSQHNRQPLPIASLHQTSDWSRAKGWLAPLAIATATIVTTSTSLALGILTNLMPNAQAGEFFTEETTSAAVDIVHGWSHTQGAYTISVTNSSRSRLTVPLDVSGAQTCGLTALGLTDGSTVSLGSLDEACSLTLFPHLDRLINQQVQTLLITLDNQLVEIPTTAADRLALARVANQSRDAYLLFQNEVAKAVATYTGPPSNTPAAPAPVSPTVETQSPPTAAAPPAASPAASAPAVERDFTPIPSAAPPATTTNAAAPPVIPNSEAELAIVGNIREDSIPGGSRLTVQAINTSNLAVRAAQARFEFSFNNRVVDTRTVAFNPNTIPPGTTATAEVTKTEQNWDSVNVSFVWDRPVPSSGPTP